MEGVTIVFVIGIVAYYLEEHLKENEKDGASSCDPH